MLASLILATAKAAACTPLGADEFAELVASPGSRFRVVRRVAPVRGTEPLGFLAERVADARRVVPLPVRRTLVEGAFDAFSFRDVHDVAATRQAFAVAKALEAAIEKPETLR